MPLNYIQCVLKLNTQQKTFQNRHNIVYSFQIIEFQSKTSILFIQTTNYKYLERMNEYETLQSLNLLV